MTRPRTWPRADVVVAASSGTAPAPQLVLRALGAGAVPVASQLPRYAESLDDGELGLMFEPRDALTLAAQLDRLVADPDLLGRFRERVDAARARAGVERRGRPLRRAVRGHRRAPPRPRRASPRCASAWPGAS